MGECTRQQQYVHACKHACIVPSDMASAAWSPSPGPPPPKHARATTRDTPKRRGAVRQRAASGASGGRPAGAPAEVIPAEGVGALRAPSAVSAPCREGGPVPGPPLRVPDTTVPLSDHRLRCAALGRLSLAPRRGVPSLVPSSFSSPGIGVSGPSSASLSAGERTSRSLHRRYSKSA